MKRLLIAGTVLIALLAVPSHGGINRWTPSLQTPTPRGQGSVAIDPTDPAIAYAATPLGVFKTMNRGEQWVLVESFPNATAIAIDPRNPASAQRPPVFRRFLSLYRKN